jgi:alkanesulfonate monooxygenase SsuD/methylene tetrahydromethanopterin reductase-like flavin-dependent oxidoreductase (luciferase family)
VPLFLTPDEYDAGLTALRAETAACGRGPEDVDAGVVAFVHVSDHADAAARGAAWLSDLYRVPPKAFQRHLVAGPARACAAALWRYAEAGARHVIVMVAGSPAVEHFRALRAAFEDEAEQRGDALVGAGRA